MSAPAIPPETRTRQRLATDPTASAFVSANAGSGKTFVLTRRVIRLMLAGCDPGRILCLTFTKAAAAEMANRVFGVLGAWATADDAALSAEIAEIEGAAPGAARLAGARRLFARALETPGGLKVQTIHAFAESLLQRFSVEANLAGRFEVLDDRGAALLRAEARDRTVRDTVSDPEGPLAAALVTLLAVTSDDAVEKALFALMDEREALVAWIGGSASLDAALAALPAALGAPAGLAAEDVAATIAVSPDFPADGLEPLLAAFDGAGKTSSDFARGARAALAATGPARAEAWAGLFVKEDGTPKSADRAIVKAMEAAFPGLRAGFAREADRIAGLLTAQAALETAARTAALVRLADRTIGHYQALKAAHGALDYDDLILRAATLLSRADAAAWVQYKLDEGLDHILVDEAQDTSPKQWEIVEALAGDFFSGAGARGDAVRTLFAVGDEKQSIYSFQGAAPQLFGRARDGFRDRIRGAGGTFHGLELTLSFRSTADVVKGVDRVFAQPDAHAGLTSAGGGTVHETVRGAEPGLVEVWPETEADPAPEPARWEDPVDHAGRGSADQRLAERIAEAVAGWIHRGERLEATGRRIRPGDVLVLVRKRGAFVEAVNRALKARGVAVAGADRLDVIGHIVVQDLLAAARAALMPEDDLTVAAAARSPLVGIGEEDLFRLAHGRGGSLAAAAAEAAAGGDADGRRLTAALSLWRERAGRLEPHGFFSTLIGPDGARAAYRARFGREADEVIDEFLSLVFAFEDRETATLQGLICRLDGMSEVVKREVDAGRDEVRVMTVHGAKGLEAPIVFLVDPGDEPASSHHLPAIVALGDGEGAPLAWVQGGLKPAPVRAALDRHRLDQAAEYRRLLYVGLTRARDRLIVTGIRRRRVKPDGRWHALVAAALSGEAEEIRGTDGAVRAFRWRHGTPASVPAAADAGAPPAAPPPLPAFLFGPPPPEPRVVTLNPSAALAEPAPGSGPAGSRRAAPGLDADTAASRRGTLIHRLLQVLPDVDREERAARAGAFLAREAADMATEDRQALLDGVTAVLDDPRFAGLFGPESRAEIGIAGDLPAPDGRRVAVDGQIDRMVTTDGEILVVDYKTGRVPAEVPDVHAAQLAVYRALLLPRAGGRRVRCAILWTETLRLDVVSDDRLDRLLAKALTQTG